ncbi:response regulator transcription factor [Leucothrix pacifica]|uniref:DNA-binding response regulator n=1 Tax=Leucothrix pacifica TaxID=1247513 RepID=A0A317C0Y4_9GAMM|nr:response regulator transcription factor [Leucothrix pacifica]PWQ92305.1 DNA-binding response regulator [Leucothrix pacifica]
MLVLLVEDHHLLAETLIDYLALESIEVDYAANGLAGLELAKSQPFDAIILDVNLPGMDGFTICQKLRQTYQIDTPILMLTARDQLEDKMTGFAQGADDYLVKPFENQELVMRLQALVKRHRGEVTQKKLQVGDLVLDVGSQQVSREGKPIELSPTCFRILTILVRDYPQVVTREAIEQELWGSDVPDTDVLRSHIYNLRKGVDNPFESAMIQTVKGVGLRLHAD